MALNINTNIGALMASASATAVNRSMETSMERLSTGLRINSAADDAAGVSISTRMEAQIRGLNQAIRNAGDGQSMVATAEGSMNEITNMLQRMRELSVQAASDTMNTQDRENLNAEITQLKSEIDRVVANTRFNDQVLLDGSLDATLQIGAKSGETLSFKVNSMSTSVLGSSASAITGTASVSASATGTQAVSNVVNLTFNGNDSYGFTLVLDEETGTGATNKQLVISGATVAGFSAQDVAAKINNEVAKTAAVGYVGVNLTGVLEARASGNTVTLINKEGSSIDFSNFTSAGAGTMTVNPVTNSAAQSVTLENTTELTSLLNTGGTVATASTSTLQLQEGHKYQFRVNDTLIQVDATAAGIAKATGGDIDGLREDVAAAITAAIQNTSGAATATVDISGSVDGSSAGASDGRLQFRMSDSTGADINISGFQKVTSSAVSPGFLTIETDIGTPAPTIIQTGEAITTDKDVGGTALEIEAGKTGRIQFSNQSLSYSFNFAGADYTIDGATKDFNAELARVANDISAAGGVNVTATNNGGVLEIVNNTADNLAFGTGAISAPGIDAVTAGNAFFLQATAGGTDISGVAGVISMVDGNIVRSNNGVAAEASRMSLSFSANDRYTFSLDKDGIGGATPPADATFTFDVVAGNLTGAMNTINSQSSTTGVTASIEGSELILTKADGTAFAIHGFSSETGGQINAANAAGQGGSGTLQNAGDGASMTVSASGKAVATEVELIFSAAAADKYSFKISDGSSTAIVRATSTEVAGGTSDTAVDSDADTAAILTEINSALSAANMSHIEAVVSGNDDGTILLKNKLGGKIDILDFKSDGTGQMTVAPKTGQGVGKILDDDALSSAYDSIASINALTSASANLAIEAIDRAMENVNVQRSELGAISNRLDHTISNLTNVSINTSAAQSRIQDADFATESTQLAKSQILQQASMAMLAQANASKQSVLSLLQ